MASRSDLPGNTVPTNHISSPNFTKSLDLVKYFYFYFSMNIIRKLTLLSSIPLDKKQTILLRLNSPIKKILVLAPTSRLN